MSVLWILIPISLIFAGLWLVVFIGANRTGQFEDLDKEAQRILFDGQKKLGPSVGQQSSKGSNGRHDQ